MGGLYYSDRNIQYLNDIVGTDFATGGPDASLGRVSSRSLDDKTKDMSVGEVTLAATESSRSPVARAGFARRAISTR